MAASKKSAKEPSSSGTPKAGKKPVASKTVKPAVKSAASKKQAPKPADKPTTKNPAAAKPAAKKPAAAKPAAKKPAPTAASKAAPGKPLPGVAVPVPGAAPVIPAQIITFLEKFDALKPGKTWAAKAAALIEKIPAALFGEFEDALDLESPLSSGRIPLHLVDPKTAKTGKGTLPPPRPAQKTFGAAVLGNKLGREDLEELIERLRWCLCCCHCWPCRPWPFCGICRCRLVKVSSTADSGWVYHLNFLNASAAIADRVAEITCPSGGPSGGPWAPQTWNASTPTAEAPVGYSPDGHDHDADYAAAGHNHDSSYAAAGHNHDSSYAAAGHNHDSAYAAANHDNTSHTKKYFSRTNLIMKANPDTTLDAGHYWVKIQLSLPVGFTPGTSNWAECVSGVCMDPTMAAAPLDLQAV